MISHGVLNSKTILLIGSGRLAKHLQHWNSLQSTPNALLLWNRSEDLHTLPGLVARADIIWLAITDSALQTFFETHLIRLSVVQKIVVHFSGAFSDERMACAHPLMTFPAEMLPDLVYHQTWFAIDGTMPLSTLLPGFSNSSFQVSAVEKPLYHALCVVAGNFPQLLWNEVDQRREALHIPDSAFTVYLQQTLANFLKLKSNSLTGPLVRHDQQTLSKNADALVNTRLHSIYSAFVKEFSS